MRTYDTESFLKSLKVRAAFPSDQNHFTDEELLNLASEEMQSMIVPATLAARENYYLQHIDLDIKIVDRDGFGNAEWGMFEWGEERKMDLSDVLGKAYGQRIDDIHLLDSKNGDHICGIPQITKSDLEHVAACGAYGFMFKDNDIVFFPEDRLEKQKIRIYYYRRPNHLVLPHECARVVFSNPVDKIITIDNLPPNITLTDKVDIVKAKPGFDTHVDDAYIENIDGNKITLSKYSKRIDRGDYLCLSGCAPVLQIPENAYPVHAQLMAAKVLEILGEKREFDAAFSQFELMMNQYQQAIEDRAESSYKKLKNLNGLWGTSGRGRY